MLRSNNGTNAYLACGATDLRNYEKYYIMRSTIDNNSYLPLCQ
ncbi:MAG: hypothetical protein ACRC68_12605 [Clostridium sp.]